MTTEKPNKDLWEQSPFLSEKMEAINKNKEEIEKEFSPELLDVVTSLQFPDKFWNIIDKLMKEEFEKGKAEGVKEIIQIEIKMLEDLKNKVLNTISTRIFIEERLKELKQKLDESK